MFSASDAFASPITYNGIVFPYLTMQDYGQLESAVRQTVIKRTKEQLVAAGVQAKDQLSHVVSIAQRLVTVIDVRAYVDTSDGALKVLELSLKRAGTDVTAAQSIPVWDAIKLARRVSTFEQMFLDELAEDDARRKAFAAERAADGAGEPAADQTQQ